MRRLNKVRFSLCPPFVRRYNFSRQSTTMSKTLAHVPRKADLVIFQTHYTARLTEPERGLKQELPSGIAVAFIADRLWGTGNYVTDAAWPAERIQQTLKQLPRGHRGKLIDGIVAFSAGGKKKLDLALAFRLFQNLQNIDYCSLFGITDMQARTLKDGTTVLLVYTDSESG